MSTLTIHTSDLPLAFRMKNEKAPDGVSIVVPPIVQNRSEGLGNLFEITIAFVSGVSAQVLASWLYDKMKDSKPDKITINHKEIVVSKGEITRIIEEQIEIDGR